MHKQTDKRRWKPHSATTVGLGNNESFSGIISTLGKRGRLSFTSLRPPPGTWSMLSLDPILASAFSLKSNLNVSIWNSLIQIKNTLRDNARRLFFRLRFDVGLRRPYLRPMSHLQFTKCYGCQRHPHMPMCRCGYIGYCLFVCVCVCTVTDFSGEDKASGVTFCTVVRGCPGQGISQFGEICSPRSPKSDESARGGARPGTPSACVDSGTGTYFVHTIIIVWRRCLVMSD